MTQNEKSMIVGISSMTLKNVSGIFPKKSSLPGLKNMSFILNNILSNIFQKFKYTLPIQKTTLKVNEVIPFDKNISLKLLENGSLEIIEYD